MNFFFQFEKRLQRRLPIDGTDAQIKLYKDKTIKLFVCLTKKIVLLFIFIVLLRSY